MRLPGGLEQDYKHQLREYERSKTMPYITSIERMGREEGRVEALREAILDTLEARFSEVPHAVRERVKALEDAAQLKVWHRQAVTSASLAAFQHDALG